GSLIEQMVAECIRVRQREVPKPVRESLRKAGNGDNVRQKLTIGEGAGLVAVHEEKLSCKMALLTLIRIEIGDELIISIVTRSGEGAHASSAILRRWNNKLAVRQLSIEDRQRHRRDVGRRRYWADGCQLTVKLLSQ